jgi:maltose-binding protein MalE
MFSKQFTFKTITVTALAALVMGGIMLQSSSKVAVADGTAVATQAPTVTPTPLPSTEGTLTIWVDHERAAMIAKVGADFTKKTNIPVRVSEMPFGDIRNNFVVAGPAGNGPDILIGAHDWVGQFYANGLVSTIDLGDKAANFDPVALKAFTYDGNLVGMPYLVEAVALYYNKDLVPTPPATWDDLKKISTQLQSDKKVDLGFIIPGGDAYHAYPLFSGFGGYIFGRDKAGNYNPKDVGVDSDGAIAAAKELDALVKAGLVKDGVDYGTMTTLFKSGKAAMAVTGPWQLDDFRSGVKNLGVAKLPTINGKPMRPFVGSQGFMVNKLSKNELLAKTFLTDYVATDEAFDLMYKSKSMIPALLSYRKTVTDQDLLTFAASVADGDPMPAIPEMASVWDNFAKALNLITQQKSTPDQAMKDAAQAIRDKIAGK